ncbi:arginine--tRNA ligase [Garciella nitratireducens]|uniref:Arginine--tRNA ligase n=1 Tax=Garciella nitratireducens DSM 15102 TaxID=1121911 RepID=A0A1T4MH65_9FIRM|nr:arginine--tRNA ligase [Garciella nitratireducens]SJZ66118.1 arginyl-tRNA synthetase [Garciella nitratireducens DSM 15102]
MNNVMENLQNSIKKCIQEGLLAAKNQGELSFDEIPEFILEVPREKSHGDFATNIAMQMAKQAKKAPRVIAQSIVNYMNTEGTYIDKIEIAGPGFINFKLDQSWLYEVLKDIQQKKDSYGEISIGKGKRINVEFVSANPTGPMHMGNARGGALGDSLAALLKAAGYEVTKEFYINDAGNQIERFGESLEARYLQLLGEKAEIPEGGYQGEDITEHMRNFIEIEGDRYLKVDSETRRATFVEYALQKNIDRLKKDLEEYGIHYDVWFSEKKKLHETGAVKEVVEILKERGHTYEKDGAVWFKCSEFGGEKDEVLVRKNGIPTYFAADIAYHRDKLEKRKFDLAINIWGADHHGHIARLKGALEAIGIDPDKLEVIIIQLVRLYRNGEIARMSKRSGKSITLSDLVEEIGKDAARFFFNLRSADSHLDFDLDLAVKQSNENPVFYVQYAHARICSILRQMQKEGVCLDQIQTANPNLLKEEQELDLIRRLADLPQEIEIAARNLDPSRITHYVLDVASLFHSFYNACRVRVEEEELMKARLLLVVCTRQVLKNVLMLLGVNAPERM